MPDVIDLRDALRGTSDLPQIDPLDVVRIRAARARRLASYHGPLTTLSSPPPLEAGMYQDARAKGLTFTEFLEEIDPTPEGCPLDAFERRLALADLPVYSARSVSLDAFYETDSKVLFPEYIDREIRIGMELGRNNLRLDDIVATTTTIDGGSYENAEAEIDDAKVRMAQVAQGAEFPTVNLKVTDRPLKLAKVGVKIRGTYEFRRRIKANVFAVILHRIGMVLGKDLAGEALSVAINGIAGQSNAAPVDNAANLGTFTYKDFVTFDQSFDPYEASLLVASKEMIIEILTMNQFADPQAGFNFQSSGRYVTPFGNTLKRFNDLNILPTDQMVGVQADMCIEKVVEAGASLTESDKIISGQWEEIVISDVVGFSKLFKDAARVFNRD